MGRSSYVQTSFLGGEWADTAQGQTDNPRYKSAMNVCLNGLPIEEKAWTRRSGFQMGDHTRNGAPARVGTYELLNSAAAFLEFSDGFMRLFYGPSLILDANVPVTSISAATPAILALPAAQTWATSDQVKFAFGDRATAATCKILANRQVRLVKIDTTHYSLFDPLTGAPLNGADVGWIGGLNLKVGRITEFVTPYSAQTWAALRLVQSDKSALLLHTAVQPELLSVVTEAVGAQPPTFSLAPSAFLDGPYLDPIAGAQMNPSGTSGLIGLSLSFQSYDATKAYSKGDFVTSVSIIYQSLQDANTANTPAASPTFWQAVTGGTAIGPNGFVATDVGRAIRLFSEPPLWQVGVGHDYTAGATVAFGGSYWTSLTTMTGITPAAGATDPNQPGIKATTWALNPNAARWTWGRIVSLSTTGFIDPTAAPKIGLATIFGGLAAAFDGATSKAAASCAAQSYPNGGTPQASVGCDFSSSPKAINSAIVYPSNDAGWIGDSPLDGVKIQLFASNVAPAGFGSPNFNGTGATKLAEVNTLNAFGVPVTLLSNDSVSLWNYVWVYVSANPPGPNGQALVAQLQLFNTSAPAGTAINVAILGDPLFSTTIVRTWRLGVYSNTTGWPTCGGWHEGRFWLASLIANRIDACVANGFPSFAPTKSDGTVTDQNAISYTFNSKKRNTIFWFQSEKEGIIVGTSGGEWLISATANNNILTPTSIQAHPVTEYKCANIEPRKTGLTTVFVQKYRRRILEYLTDAFSGKHYGPNLSEHAKHLAKTGVAEIAYQEELAPILWARMSDGSLAGCTYRRIKMFSSEQAEFFGWHRHTLGSNRKVESIAVGGDMGGILDTLVAVTNDQETNIRHVEFHRPLQINSEALQTAWFLDDAKVPSSAERVTINSVVNIRFHGLWHLNGKSISVFAAGLDCGDFQVVNGHVDVPYGAAGGNFTERFLIETAASAKNGDFNMGDMAVDVDQGAFTIPAVVGFTYNSDGQLVRPSTPQETGAQLGPPFGKYRSQKQCAALLSNTRGLWFGTKLTDARLIPAIFKKDDDTALPINKLFSGVLGNIVIEDDHGFDGMLAWRVKRPYPATIAAVGGFIKTEDK